MHVLFIGNSFTSRNDLPTLLASMANAANLPFSHELISAGGASLRRHWNAGLAVRRIEEDAWDYVVLQEQSTLPIKNAARYHNNVRLFAPVIRRHPSARLVLFQTWPRAQAPESAHPLSEAIGAIAQELDALLIPVGRVWQQARLDSACPELYDRDGSHPSLAGSWLAACTFAHHLLHKLPMICPEGLAPYDAHHLRELAHKYA